MTTPNSSYRPPEPLTPEERKLAARLAQIGPHGTPPPALDARIIAAAHAVADAEVRSRQGRWPALLGLAATLALAIGMTWRMQPGGEAVSRDEASRERAPAVAAEAVADSAEPAPVPAGRPAPQLADDVSRSREEAVPRRVPGPATQPDQAPATVSGRARPAASAMPAPPLPLPQSAPPAAPPAPRVAEQAIDAATPVQAQRATKAGPMPERRAESNAASAPMDPARPDASAAAGARGDLAAVPVVRDSELALADWFDRIRLRRDAGDLAGARESLRLLRHAHPQAALPDDLRALADGHLDQR